MEILVFVIGAVVGAVLSRVLGHARSARTSAAPPDPAPAGSAPSDAQDADLADAPEQQVQRLRQQVEALDDQIHSPADLARVAQFEQGAALLAGPAFSDQAVIEALGSPGWALPSMAAVALQHRRNSDLDPVLELLPHLGSYPLNFVLDYLQAQPDADHLHVLLRQARDWWWDVVPFRQRLRAYLHWAASKAPADRAVDVDGLDDAAVAKLGEILGRFKEPVLDPFLQRLQEARAQRREQRVLGGFGRVVAAVPPRLRLPHPTLDAALQRAYDLVTAVPPQPVLLVGEHGVGKSVLIDLLSERLLAEGWRVFEATAAEILAGQSYIGELEGRIREMLAVLHRERALWRAPDFYDLLHKGAHARDPRGILDLVMPALERGELRLIGEITPQQLAQLQVARPTTRSRFEVVTLAPAAPAALAQIGAQWAQAQQQTLQAEVIDAHTLAEAQRMAAQYSPEQHEPGRLLRLLEETLQAATSAEVPRLPLDDEALLQAVSRRSGLPLDVIDDRQRLDLDALRHFFRQRVLGQDEAVETLLDRIAMLKAGLIDSRRPIGVFLFAGPTGTGKTELAKALGELLFGTPERLLRLDMSEFQGEDALYRLTGDDSAGQRTLIARIREQPFSVVLLDEFEKAHPKVWDLFLQVFDDARLSDRNGNTADFRHSIIILTSNVGATLARAAGPGFATVAGGYSRSAVEKAVYETFRREFVNRLDRLVLFNPLDRALMREILHKELDRTLTRRGLRNRAWAVEWEPSAIEFLLDRGFTPDLGARPLRRAIEQHLLAPLARSIVEQTAPEGDQFLFVRGAGDRLDVRFIAPDAPAAAPAPSAAGRADAPLDLRDIVYAPVADEAALARMDAALSALQALQASDAWQQARDADFASMGERDFWSQPGRFQVLDRIERRDRIDSALNSAVRMRARLQAAQSDGGFVGRLAQLLWLLRLACDALQDQRAQDALLDLRIGASELHRHGADARQWWQRVLQMYLAWAEQRNMRVDVLRQDPEQGHAWLAIGGFGALDLLEMESGLHVQEQDADEPALRRLAVQVRVAADVAGQPRRPAQAEDELRVCRRYRIAPSPLVRDSVRGWRSGRLERVLGGDFDVMPIA
ncbi:ATP-dependent Clp protease ATP-binding subunit ClpC [Xanthomonas sacchari]|uniref:AAA family ATPase n=1 Tax=Xanthomonas sp. F10 TaxID=3035309 RepID=UPI00161DFF18|nr:AAA family ATPase [Xanthomonas sp. F10]MBB6366886.1 ATP-dependent Clp protease ATP-binding subunit ClpC [Xanthomonas sp. F10]